MMGYNKNTGRHPQLNDRVEVCHTLSEYDGETGFIGGFGDPLKYIAIVVLDSRMQTGESVMFMPVVCLKLT